MSIEHSAARPNSPRLQRIIRRRNLHAFVGLGRTQLDQMIKRGEFPAAIKLNDGGRAVGWLEGEVLEWQRQRMSKRDDVRSQNFTGLW
jgi:prophage regulatory protein